MAVKLEAIGGVSYTVSEEVPFYPRPSRLAEESGTLEVGEAIRGYPAGNHWIYLASENAKLQGLEFVSHWVFQHPLYPSLCASWCKLRVQRKGGVMKVTWPGLQFSKKGTFPIFYCLEWNFFRASRKCGCGMVQTPETWSWLRSLKRFIQPNEQNELVLIDARSQSLCLPRNALWYSETLKKRV